MACASDASLGDSHCRMRILRGRLIGRDGRAARPDVTPTPQWQRDQANTRWASPTVAKCSQVSSLRDAREGVWPLQTVRAVLRELRLRCVASRYMVGGESVFALTAMPNDLTPTEVQAARIADLEAQLQLEKQKSYRLAAENRQLRCGIVVEKGKLVQFPTVPPSREALSR
jgi:hypothetical protein